VAIGPKALTAPRAHISQRSACKTVD
jgi:hypothetical protein